jgi:dolichol-phosphate mannosyltransferase
MSKLKLTIVTPVFNEEEVITHFYERTRAVLDLLDDVDSHILFVVDRSTDNTLEVLRKLVNNDIRSRVLAMSSRFGHQMALLAGIEHSKCSDIIIMMDSDLQHPPELIPDLIKEYRNGAAVVYTIRQRTEDVGFARRSVGNLFYRILRSLSRVPINPNAADFRLIDKRVANVLTSNFTERNLFLRGIFTWMGFNQASIEYTAEKRLAGKSKYSLTKMFQLATAGILSFSTRPLHAGMFIGASFALFAFVLIVIALLNYCVAHSIPSGWTTIVILLLLFSGVQLVVTGIIGIYIGGIYEEVKGRPRYIIEEEICSND